MFIASVHVSDGFLDEDKLQDGVPEAIVSVKAAGIRFWVLTGDKTETAAPRNELKNA